MDARQKAVAFFNSRITYNGQMECILWPGKKESRDGYGVIAIGLGKNSLGIKKFKYFKAHRLSYEIFYRTIIPKNEKYDKNTIIVCHSCDKPLCVNPRHLFIGTNKDNYNDSFKKGRTYKQRLKL
jgi:hypothetical protein